MAQLPDSSPGRGTVFLDRDGTINRKAPEGSYITAPGDLHLLPGAARAIRTLAEAGLRIVIVTNQRGVARGLMRRSDLDAVHARLTELLSKERAFVDAVYACCHGVGECGCRKPLPGLFLQAAHDNEDIALGHSVMVGDAETDMQAAEAAGVHGIKLSHEAVGATAAVAVAPDLDRAAQLILTEAQMRSRLRLPVPQGQP